MNVTEQFEEILRLARAAEPGYLMGKRSASALEKFAQRVRRMRAKLDDRRWHREFFRKLLVSQDHLHEELTRVNACDACGWKCWEFHGRHGNSPLRCCTNEFDCALQRLHYRFSPWYPEKGVTHSTKHKAP